MGLWLALGLAACNSDNQGSTPADTEIKGTIAGNPAPASLRTISGTVEWPPPAGLKTIGRGDFVCDVAQPVSLVLEDAEGGQTTWAFDSKTFEFEAETEQNFRLFLTQGETPCAALHFSDTQSWSGLKTVLGAGEEDVELGAISFFGGGLILAANDPAGFTDNDGDGVTDDQDSDANGDGLPDADLDYDGLIDWAQFTSAGTSLPTADECDVLFLWPSHRGPFLVAPATRMGRIVLHINDEVETVTALNMRLLDQDDKVVKAPFTKTWIADTPTGPAIAIQTIPLTLGSDYTLIIPPESFTCQGGADFQNHLEIEFTPYLGH
jgi:hypothetical protein